MYWHQSLLERRSAQPVRIKKMIADTTREVITVPSNTGKYPPTYGDLFPDVIERGGTVPPQTEWRCSHPGLGP